MLKKPVRPDFDARDEKISKLQAKVKEYADVAKAKTSQIDAIMNENKSNNKLEDLKRSLADSVHTKTRLQKLVVLTKQRMDEISAPPKAPAKKGLNLSTSPDDILRTMGQLEQRVMTESDPVESEKIVARIQALHASYQQLTGSAEKNGAHDGEQLRAKLCAELSKHREQMAEVASKEASQRAELDALRSQMNATQPDIDKLIYERDQCNEVVRSLRDKIHEIKDDYQAQFESWKTQMDAWKADMDVIMAERRAERAEENKARDEERARRELEARGAPFSTEIMRCEQLLLWCKQYQKDEVKVESKSSAGTVGEAPAGMVAMSKRNIEDDDIFSSSARTKGKKKAGKKLGASEHKADKAGAQRIQLDMETLGMFSKMRLPVPGAVGDIPGLLDKVQAKKVEYEEKQKRALAGEKVEEEEVAEKAGPSAKADQAARGTVTVDLRCDEAFGMVLLELTAH